ncbi:MAG TPA: helix-turn-helix domain-containing protein [Nitrososphaeraceae archaeon]|nr:helix-turn-helix domain-containing protein [Nitrososphaeraceae archaeon]
MSNSIENEENLYLSVKESFNRGVIRGPSQSNFFEFFDFIGNPFDTSFLITNQKLIAKSTKVIINKLAERIGACHKNERHLILVGPECSGRSSILKIIENFLNKGFDKNFSLYVNAQDRWSGFTTAEDGNDDHFDRIDNFQQWVKEVDFQNSRIILVDDADSFISHAVQYCNAIKLDGLRVPTFIYCITNVTYSYVINNERLSKIFGDVFWLGVREEREIKKIVLESTKNTLKSDVEQLTLFDDYTLDYIVNHSFGLPGLTSFFIISCLKTAYQANTNKIEKRLIQRIADIEGFTLAKKIVDRNLNLDGTKYKILVEILRQYYIDGERAERKKIISKFSNMARSTLAYHFKDLINENVIKQDRIGLRVYYTLQKPIRCALELIDLGLAEIETRKELDIKEMANIDQSIGDV